MNLDFDSEVFVAEDNHAVDYSVQCMIMLCFGCMDVDPKPRSLEYAQSRVHFSEKSRR